MCTLNYRFTILFSRGLSGDGPAREGHVQHPRRAIDLERHGEGADEEHRGRAERTPSIVVLAQAEASLSLYVSRISCALGKYRVGVNVQPVSGELRLGVQHAGAREREGGDVLEQGVPQGVQGVELESDPSEGVAQRVCYGGM